MPFEETLMFQAIQRKELVVAACLLWVLSIDPSAHAGHVIAPAQIDGQYNQDNSSTPLTLKLSDGFVTGPPGPLTSFTASNITITFNTAGLPISITPNFVMTGAIPSPPTTETITYSFSGSPTLVSGSEIADNISVVSNVTSPPVSPAPISLIHLNPARLLLIFPSDPSGAPVLFEIVPIPEPATIVLMSTGGVLGWIGSWMRHRRRTFAAAE
jgi:hypothetical protein